MMNFMLDFMSLSDFEALRGKIQRSLPNLPYLGGLRRRSWTMSLAT